MPFRWTWGVTSFSSFSLHRLAGLVVRRPPRERKIPGSNPTCAGIFSGSNHTSDFKIGTPVATLPGAWRERVSAGTGWPGVSILWLGEMESLIYNFCLSVAARNIVWLDPSLRCTRMLLGRYATNQQQFFLSVSICLYHLGRSSIGHRRAYCLIEGRHTLFFPDDILIQKTMLTVCQCSFAM